MISINYDNNGSVKLGVVALQVQYSPSDLSIIYLDVNYCDKEIEKRIKTNPHVMKTIESFFKEQITRSRV